MGYSEMARRMLWNGGLVCLYLRNRRQSDCRRADDFGILRFLGAAVSHFLKGKASRKALPYNLHCFPRNHYDGYFRRSGGIIFTIFQRIPIRMRYSLKLFSNKTSNKKAISTRYCDFRHVSTTREKNFKKTLKKQLTKGNGCGIIIRRSENGARERTLKIKQRR